MRSRIMFEQLFYYGVGIIAAFVAAILIVALIIIGTPAEDEYTIRGERKK